MAGTGWNKPFVALYRPQNGQKWPFWAVLTSLVPIWPIFWLEQGGTHPLESRFRCEEVMLGLCPAKKVIFGAPEASKLARIGQF